MKSNYFRFLELAATQHEESDIFESMDSKSKQLLNVIAFNEASGNPLTVPQALALRSISSKSTLREKLKGLVKLNLVDVNFQDENKKTKYLVPTMIANEYFSILGSAMQQLLKI